MADRISRTQTVSDFARHEMRTPIQAILTYSELLQLRPEGSKKWVQAILRNAMRLERIAKNFLNLSTIESLPTKLVKERFWLDELLSSIADDFRTQVDKPVYGSKTLELALEAKEKIMVEADKGMIAEVISNILDNAFKFTTEGRITATLQMNADLNEASVTITDTGPGVDPLILPSLFSMLGPSGGESGLGLYICKRILEAHGGRIWERNIPEGGAVFAFVLPAVQPAEQEV